MQNDFGLISIIMAAYNAEKTIEQAINSVLSQTYPDFELLVVNDCSTDKTAMLAEAIVKKDDRVRLISNEKNSGVSYTRKHGLEEASGEWVAILDSDDAWAPEKLEKQINLQKKTNADLLFTGSAFMDADGKPIDWYLAAPAEVTYRQLLKQNVLSNSSALVRKELYAKYYAVGDGMHEDFALWLNILKDGRKAYGVDEPLLIYRIAKSSKSGNKFKAAKMNWNTYALRWMCGVLPAVLLQEYRLGISGSQSVCSVLEMKAEERDKTVKITFISNFLGPHQLPFCKAMVNRLGEDFKFVATEPMTEERIKLGWSLDKDTYPFEIKANESNELQKKAEQLAIESDVVIIGSAPDSYIIPRLKRNKLTFKYSERPLKKGIHWNNLAHIICGMWLHHGRFQSKPLYMLAASAYTADDYARFGCYRGKCYKWGYFPEAKKYDPDELMKGKLSAASDGLKRPCVSILWAGRLIGWKHPDASIRLAESLKEKGYSFKMTLIGTGEMEEQLHNMIRDKSLEDCVEMPGAMKASEVRSYMEKADIYLFTSDFNEGWGAVLNESMNSGCAVVASHAIGSVPFLIKDEENGLIYENGNQKQLEQQVCRLMDDAEYRMKLGLNAYHTIADLWNADVAAERLIDLCENIIFAKKTKSPYENGICSEAKVMENDWFGK